MGQYADKFLIQFGFRHPIACFHQFIGGDMQEMPKISYFCFLYWEFIFNYNIMLHMF